MGVAGKGKLNDDYIGPEYRNKDTVYLAERKQQQVVTGCKRIYANHAHTFVGKPPFDIMFKILFH